MELTVVIHKAEEGGYWAEIPCLKGCVSEGETKEEVLVNIHEAFEGWLKVAAERDSRIAKKKLKQGKMIYNW